MKGFELQLQHRVFKLKKKSIPKCVSPSPLGVYRYRIENQFYGLPNGRECRVVLILPFHALSISPFIVRAVSPCRVGDLLCSAEYVVKYINWSWSNGDPLAAEPDADRKVGSSNERSIYCTFQGPWWCKTGGLQRIDAKCSCVSERLVWILLLFLVDECSCGLRHS